MSPLRTPQPNDLSPNLTPRISEFPKTALEAFFENPAGAELGSVEEVRGFVFAVAGTPELVPPSEWLPEAFREESGRGKSLDEIAHVMQGTFGEAMVEYVQLGQSIYQARLEHERSRPPRGARVGRNEPCPCGSGRKHKKCCGAAVH
jgi:uncharacterized protein YecA (UPF0149 family)